jgi:glycosyltransferase involved in cell wall biosynthesis
MPSLVSIGIPCFNAERWIAASVSSALDQTWPAKEVIVVDDGSTDRTLEELRKFGDGIRVEQAAHGGANRARNILLEAARGEWIQYLDADDYLRPEKIARQFGEAGPAEQIDVIYSPILLETWREGRALPPAMEPIDTAADIYTQLLRWQLPQTSGGLWRKAALEAIGGWDEDPTQLCDEHDCYFRALKAGMHFAFAPTPNAVYRIWSEETRCHSNQRPVILSRTALSEALRDWLKARGQWTRQHQEALGQSLLEMARNLASQDLEFAARYHSPRKAEMHLAGPAAPKAYQVVYRALGFRAAELVGKALR